MSAALWGYAAVSIVLVSWIFYRYLAPKRWREWARAGIVQAFIIAFYAEMYGFPVTLYVLSRMCGLDVSGTFWDGNLWVYLFGTRSVMVVSMIAGYSLAVLGILLVASAWRELYRARKDGRLASGGPYAIVRHPQYTGFSLLLFGEGVVHWPTVFSLAVVPVLVVVYVLLARREEREMTERFGERYREYQRRVPMFFPHPRGWRRLFAGTPSRHAPSER